MSRQKWNGSRALAVEEPEGPDGTVEDRLLKSP